VRARATGQSGAGLGLDTAAASPTDMDQAPPTDTTPTDLGLARVGAGETAVHALRHHAAARVLSRRGEGGGGFESEWGGRAGFCESDDQLTI
jgi:hypothetical protein